MLAELLRKGISELIPYVPGKAIEEVEKEYGVKKWVKLASNENLLGPSPKVIAAIKRELSNIYLYPEGPCTDLKKTLARKLNLPEEAIVISNGADNLILLIANAFIDEGDEVIMAQPTFPVYETAARIMGGRAIKVSLKDFTHDLSAMADQVTAKTKLLFVCNPNNPTGTIIKKRELEDLLARIPPRVIVVLDEAYGEFVEDGDYPNSLDFIREGRQVVVLRTFSKVYSLAGLRIGYALGRSDLMESLNRVREPFPVNRLAQVAAIAALADEDHVAKSIRMVHEGKRYLYRELKGLGLSYVPSQANFILIDFGKDIGAVTYDLLKEGIIIRPGKMWGYATLGRVTIGRRDDNRMFIEALKRLMGEGIDEAHR